ncbi:MAG: hypothetical protein QG575_385 [Euryarchaeota archaeon]|nr:hypothetical protein [Euryarchaeota archaeon]
MREDCRLEMSFDLWGAIKQLDWAVFAIEI